MKWITEINLVNYRAFGDSESIKIPKGNHLLIYGENGSGKSSIYYGLKDFFSSSSPTSQIKFNLNKFKEAKNNKIGNVGIIIEEDDKAPRDYQFAFPDIDSTHRVGEIILANKFKGFLDYKRMLKVHSLEIPDDKTPEIFDLLVKELLSDHKVSNPKGGVTKVELLGEYNRLIEILTTTKSDQALFSKADLLDRLVTIDEELGNIVDEEAEIKDLSETSIATKFSLENEKNSILDAIKIIDSKEQLSHLDGSLKTLLGQVIIIANKFLKNHFKNKIILDVNYRKLGYSERTNTMEESLSLKIKYADSDVEFYQAFLNEARLSSLAISLYLASIKTYDPGEEALKILYLDDVFIGLDTTNRFPLLDIIKKEFIDDGFQVFISTYDRDWFELSRNWFQIKIPGKINSLELFIEDDGNPITPDYPIVKPYDGNIAIAKAHFKAKDYPATGNYIRKECESIIKKLLLDNYKCDHEGNTIKELEPLMNRLHLQFSELNIPYPKELMDSLKIYRKSFLNPSSHDDTGSSIFKKEIEDAFELIEKLQKIPQPQRVLIVEKGQIFSYNNVQENYYAEIELCDSIFFITHNGSTSISNYKFKVSLWTWRGVNYADSTGIEMEITRRVEFCTKERSLAEIFSAINRSTNIVIPQNPEKELLVGQNGTLADLLI